MATSARRTRWFLLAFPCLVVGLVVALREIRRETTAPVVPSLKGGPERPSPPGDGLAEPLEALARDVGVEPGATDTRSRRDSSSSAKSGNGVLELHLVAASDGAPIAGQECLVYSERAGNVLHARIETDADGRARASGLPETTVLVCVPRTERTANTTRGLWLPAGGRRTLEIALDAGGSIVGRVVDDLGRPVAEARVARVRTWPEDGAGVPDESTAVRTDTEGRFELARVQDVPRAVWIVDGEIRPERHEAVTIDVRLEGAHTSAVAPVRGTPRVDLGDIMLERERLFSGRVLDTRHEPVAGAWVQLGDEPTPRDVPVPLDAPIDAHCSRTSVDGSFSAASIGKDRDAWVISPVGAIRRFELPKLGPGERADGLEFVLDDVSVVEVELRDPSGRSVVTARDATTNHRVLLLPSNRWGGVKRLLLALRGEDDLEQRRSLEAGRDGIFRVVSAFEPRTSRRVHMELPGYVPWDDVWAAPSVPLERRRYEVQPLPVIHLHVRGPEQPGWGDTNAPALVVHACLVDPASYRRQGSLGTIECCGLGSRWTSPVKQLDEQVDLPVLADRPFWIHARVQAVEKLPGGNFQAVFLLEREYGPFSPDGAVHDVEVPAVVRPPGAEPRKPPPAESPDAERKPAIAVRVHVVDAEGRKLDDVSLQLRSPTDVRGAWRIVPPDGRAKWFDLESGVHEMSVAREGYYRSKTTPVNLVADRENDLGTVVLEALPEFRVRFVEADGSVPPQGTIAISGPFVEGGFNLRGVLDDQGVLVARAEPAARMQVHVREPTGPDLSEVRAQSVTVDWDVNARELEVRLLPWQKVEVLVVGAATELPESTLRLSLVEAVDPTTGWAPERARLERLRELMPRADGARRFVLETCPGRYVVRVHSPLFRVPETTLEVRNSRETQRFELSSSR